MKKFIIPCICIIAATSLAGCANNSTNQTITALNNQLNQVENIVSSTNVNEISAVSPSVTLSSNEPYNSIQRFRALSNENMIREEELRQKILNMNAQLKACCSTEYKLSKKQANALKDITSNLNRYSSHLNDTKYQVKNSVSKIKKNLNVKSINIEEATSSYTTLNNSMNERYAYLSNIYNNLEQACIILDCGCINDNICDECKNNKSNINDSAFFESEIKNTPYLEDQNNFDKDKSENIEETTSAEKEEKGNFKIIKNIDSYAPSNNNTTTDNDKSIINNQNTQNIEPIYQTPPHSSNPPINRPIPRPYPNPKVPNNYTNGVNGYNYRYRYNTANPNRNTDTFYSTNHNIDTYRFNPHFYNYFYNY